MYLLALKDRRRRMQLVEDSVSGRVWRSANGRRITDRGMVRLANFLTGWAESVYRFGCAFIHLSNFHDRLARDPFKALPTSERRRIISHVEHDHGRLATRTPGIDDLMPLIPRVFEKIAANLKCYLDTLEHGDHRRAGGRHQHVAEHALLVRFGRPNYFEHRTNELLDPEGADADLQPLLRPQLQPGNVDST